jgi:hypothetical protein
VRASSPKYATVDTETAMLFPPDRPS